MVSNTYSTGTLPYLGDIKDELFSAVELSSEEKLAGFLNTYVTEKNEY